MAYKRQLLGALPSDSYQGLCPLTPLGTSVFPDRLIYPGPLAVSLAVLCPL